MGDVAMTIPVLKAVLDQNPTIKITFLSKPFLKPLFTDLDRVTFFEVDLKNKHKGFFGIFNLFLELKKLNVDAVADLHNVLRSNILYILFKLSGIKSVQIDKGRKEKHALTRTKNKVFKQLKTTHQRYADVFTKLGISANLSNPKFLPKEIISKELTNLTGLKNKTWLGIAPFAQHASKMYPIDLMEQVIAELDNEQNLKILLFGGGKKEIEQLELLSKKYKNTLNMAGKCSLTDELAIISNLDCMVSMDSGNAHFAAMFGIPTISIWGITHPYTGFAPFNQPKDYAILPDLKKYPNIPCSIYGNKVCEGYEDVMRTILPKTIVQKIEKVLFKKN